MSSISAYAKNSMLGGVTPDAASLHTDFPGTTGANECVGGGYARQTVSFGAASGGVRTLTAEVTFDVSAQTVNWIGLWEAGNWLFAAPAGGATPKNFMSVSSDDRVYIEGHGFSDGQKVVVYNGTPPAGLSEGTVYFVKDASADYFKLSATDGGTAINLTAGPSFGCVIAAITPRTYSGAGTFTLETSSIVIPD